MAVSRVTRNFQITVPREVREPAGIKVGDTMMITREGPDIVLRKVDRDLLAKGFGLWKKAQEKTPWLVNKLLRKEAEGRLKKLQM